MFLTRSAPLALLLLCTMLAALVRHARAEEEDLDEELSLQEEDFPDLVRADEEGGIIDEFDFLEEEIAIDEVESASKHRQSIYWSPSAITVITREDIRASGAVLLHDLLRRVAGVDILDLKRVTPVVGARALTDESNNLMLPLVDGREALHEFAGVTLWVGLVIDIEEIERIEVIRGPGSTLYGANAFAGIVNIITVPDKPVSRVELNITNGQKGFYRNNVLLREYWKISDGVLSLQAMVGNQGKRTTADNYPTYYSSPPRMHAVLRYRHQKDMDFSLHSGMLGGGGMWHTHVGDLRFADTLSLWVMAQSDLALGEIARLRAQVYHVDNEGEFTSRTSLRAFDVWIADFPTIHASFPATDGQVQLDLRLHESLLMVFGGNLRMLRVDCPQFEPSHLSEIRAAGFWHAEWAPLDEIQLTGGLRFDYSNRFDLAVSPRFVAVYRPLDNHAFRAGYGLAFRKPSLYESHAHFTVASHNPATPEIIEKLRTSLGNEDLTNEKVHSFEAGWRGGFLNNRLAVTLDLFFNIYKDTIYFLVDLTETLGMPNILQSTIQYENDSRDKHALGGELELTWKPGGSYLIWGNLGLRRVTWADSGQEVPSEPTIRANLGARYSSSWGLRLDAAVHYVSSMSFAVSDPRNLLDERELVEVGDNFILIGRLGYNLPLGDDHYLEAGLVTRTPLGPPMREFPGVRMPPTASGGSPADWGGELITRCVSLYLRGVY